MITSLLFNPTFQQSVLAKVSVKNGMAFRKINDDRCSKEGEHLLEGKIDSLLCVSSLPGG